MTRSDYAEPILKARAALQTAERLLMDGRPEDAQHEAAEMHMWVEQLRAVCAAMAWEKGQRT